eukprot:TRINITY_DN2050_c0_g1_i1.p1 TRINITY_DN2050_c0_g1~~TRINITY_DN2050_c0_g1_i1.p1  ORF type:complete len:118 (-),score=9.86 TRINITY_DN2050_c0_g1_i1:506-817(-)
MDKSLDELVEKEKKSFRGRGSNKAGTGGQGNKGKQGGQPRTENTNRGGPVRRGGRNGGRKQSPYSRVCSQLTVTLTNLSLVLLTLLSVGATISSRMTDRPLNV